MNQNKQNIAVIGSGYVGMSLATLLSQYHNVKIHDIDEEKIVKINNHISPIKDNLISKYLNSYDLNLIATSSLSDAIEGAEIIIIATPTDYDEDKDSFNTNTVDETINEILKINLKALIVVKSTLPEGHTEYLKLKHNTEKIIFSPEFLREGQALYDNLYPSRIIVGSKCKNAQIFANILKHASLKSKTKILITSSREAESIKLFSNAYLAMRVAFFNELDSYAFSKELNSREIITGISLDERIGNYYNNPSFGYGGYCLPKDTQQLLSNFGNIPQDLISSIISSNHKRKDYIVNIILEKKVKTIGFYRLAMKKDSDNSRSSAVLEIIEKIRLSSSEIIIYEPNITENTFNELEIVNNFNKFKSRSDLIVANRLDEQLHDVQDKVFSRDIFQEN